jgi:hypothetical protein
MWPNYADTRRSQLRSIDDYPRHESALGADAPNSGKAGIRLARQRSLERRFVVTDKIGGRIAPFDAVAAQHFAELMAWRNSKADPSISGI